MCFSNNLEGDASGFTVCITFIYRVTRASAWTVLKGRAKISIISKIIDFASKINYFHHFSKFDDFSSQAFGVISPKKWPAAGYEEGKQLFSALHIC